MTDTIISRLEQATEGDRELDAEIHMARGYRQVLPTEPSRYPDVPTWHDPDGASCGWLVSDTREYPPRYSTSIDAAMSLIPEGCDKWAVSGRNAATVGRPQDVVRWYYASTPAIALCIASLKAAGYE